MTRTIPNPSPLPIEWNTLTPIVPFLFFVLYEIHGLFQEHDDLPGPFYCRFDRHFDDYDVSTSNFIRCIVLKTTRIFSPQCGHLMSLYPWGRFIRNRYPPSLFGRDECVRDIDRRRRKHHWNTRLLSPPHPAVALVALVQTKGSLRLSGMPRPLVALMLVVVSMEGHAVFRHFRNPSRWNSSSRL